MIVAPFGVFILMLLFYDETEYFYIEKNILFFEFVRECDTIFMEMTTGGYA